MVAAGASGVDAGRDSVASPRANTWDLSVAAWSQIFRHTYGRRAPPAGASGDCSSCGHGVYDWVV
jgi:hypothetical protein